MNELVIEPKEKLIVALDFDSLAKAGPYIEALTPYVGHFKVGLELINAAGAPAVVHQIQRLGGRVFFDGKFSDIPNTVGQASRVVASLGVNMFNVHSSCGRAAMKAAADAKGSALLLAVTVLTSMDEAVAQMVFGATVQEKVLQFAREAQESGADGIVCSPQELEFLSPFEELKKLLRVTPGIRPSWYEANDQKRTMTPTEAIKMGSTHLVVGRPITNPPRGIGSPVDAAKKILEEIAAA
jgi:orotidine-5'-phosphate decarboxylase